MLEVAKLLVSCGTGVGRGPESNAGGSEATGELWVWRGQGALRVMLEVAELLVSCGAGVGRGP